MMSSRASRNPHREVDIVYSQFLHFFTKKNKKWHLRKKNIRRGRSMPVPLTYSSICCSYHETKGKSTCVKKIIRMACLFHLPLQALVATIMELKARDIVISQVQMEPTRGENNLDLFFTTNPSLVKNSTVVPGISDHDMVVTDCELRPIYNRRKPRKTFQFSKAN